MKFYIKKKLSHKCFIANKKRLKKEALWFSKKEKKDMKKDIIRARRKWKWLDKKLEKEKKETEKALAFLENLDPDMILINFSNNKQ